MKARNTFESCQSDHHEFEMGQDGHPDLAPPEMVVSEGVLDFCPRDKAVIDGAPPPAAAKIAQRSRCHWSHNELMALFNAKKAEADKYENEETENEKVGGKKVRVPPERWDEVADFCRAMGSNKSPSQCKEKWERIWLAFRKITDWEKQTPPGKPSFWAMQGEEREKEGFPRTFDRELFDAMATRFGFLKSIDLATIVVDSSIMDVPVDASTINGSGHEQTPVEESPSVVDDQAPGQKRKAAPPLPSCGGSSKPKAPEGGKKKRTVYGVYKVEKVEQNGGSKTTPKNKASGDFNERKLLLEERKVKLAEKRFQLEERKLEATLEIGKGLITSMERMTQTISSLGAFSSR